LLPLQWWSIKHNLKKGKKMNLEHITGREATARILKALLDNEEDISSSSSESRFLTTRITNQINGLRNSGIEIKTITVNVPGTKKYYGRYELIKEEENITNAVLLLEQIEVKLS